MDKDNSVIPAQSTLKALQVVMSSQRAQVYISDLRRHSLAKSCQKITKWNSQIIALALGNKKCILSYIFTLRSKENLCGYATATLFIDPLRSYQYNRLSPLQSCLVVSRKTRIKRIQLL